MRKFIFLVLILVCVIFCADAFAEREELGLKLKSVVTNNFESLQIEDIEATMKTIHTQAPGYLQTRELSKQLFPYYDLTYTLLSFNYIAQDGDYALARGSQKTMKETGPVFQNNIVDFIYVFKQENGQWKFWSQAVLDTKFID